MTVLSSGFEELIRPVLAAAGVLDINVLANSVDARPDGWRALARRDDVRRLRRGVQAKRSSGRWRDRVRRRRHLRPLRGSCLGRIFATRGLARYLDERGTPYEPFDDFHDVVAALKG